MERIESVKSAAIDSVMRNSESVLREMLSKAFDAGRAAERIHMSNLFALDQDASFTGRSPMGAVKNSLMSALSGSANGMTTAELKEKFPEIRPNSISGVLSKMKLEGVLSLRRRRWKIKK